MPSLDPVLLRAQVDVPHARAVAAKLPRLRVTPKRAPLTRSRDQRPRFERAGCLAECIGPYITVQEMQQVIGRRGGLVVGLWLAGCAHEAPLETAPTNPPPTAPMLGELCALSTPPQTSASPPRIFIELATLEGDVAAIQQPTPTAGQTATPPRTFSQMLADPRWEAITVRHLIAADGVRETFPEAFEPPTVSSECPTGQRWDIIVTSRVTERTPVMVSVELRIQPAGATPDTVHVPPACGAQTTVVVRDQQIVVLSGFPPSGGANTSVMTSLTPYVIWEDADVERLLECKRKLAQPNRDIVRAVPPQTTAPGAL